MNEKLLQVNNLQTQFLIDKKHILKAVNNVSFSLDEGDILGIVGESGSGKSVTAKSIMQLIDAPGQIVGGEIFLNDEDLLLKNEKEMQEIRGQKISIVFQNPVTALNPLLKIKTQMMDTIKAHSKISDDKALEKILECLNLVGINETEDILNNYPCNISDGFVQKIVIAMSLLNDPSLIIADEPTTNLGATVQEIIISSLKNIQKKTNISIIFITHDFGVIARIANKIMVMYGGKIVEKGTKFDLLNNPIHPYTEGLLTSVPSFVKGEKIKQIPGFPPNMLDLPQGCTFHPRCEYRTEKCSKKEPQLEEYNGRLFACFNPINRSTAREGI